MLLRPKAIRELCGRFRSQGLTMRRRFAVYLLLLLCCFVILLLVLLSLLGVLSPAGNGLERTLRHHLESAAAQVEQDVDRLSAYGLSFSQQMTDVIDGVLLRRQMDFSALTNDREALDAIQETAYPVLYTHIQLAPCSGAFYCLDATVNDSLPVSSCSGMYIKFVNLYAENTVNNRVCIYRGAPAALREKGVGTHSSWQLEFRRADFPELTGLLGGRETDLSRSCRLTTVRPLPETWERARFLCLPILDGEGTRVGVCGFEISDLYFRLANAAADVEPAQLGVALLSETAPGRYVGQVAGSASGYLPLLGGEITVEAGGRFDRFLCQDGEFVGLRRTLDPSGSGLSLAVVLPMQTYAHLMQQARLKLVLALCLALLPALTACLWMSKRYVAPILQGLEQVKTGAPARARIPEIDDLFGFLARKDREHEAQLRRIEQQRQAAQSQADRARTELERLADRRRQEVDPDCYALFVTRLQTLTPKEREVFGLYLEGKRAGEIREALHINENTLKYHNRNIYGKLGVSSRKELLLYATLLRLEQPPPENASP